jgi:hypothetical protein
MVARHLTILIADEIFEVAIVMLTRVIAALFVVMVLFLSAVWPQISFYMRTRHFSPIKKIAYLQSPTAVKGWTADGLLLADGRTLTLPGLRSLPPQSAALTEVTARGVEIGTNDRIYGLVKVHHWCGNDPVRERIAKVDISDMLIFLRLGEPVVPIDGTELAQYVARNPGEGFSEFGWNVSDYMQFTSWVRFKDFALEAAPTQLGD